MRAAIDAVTGRVSMYRLTVGALAAVLVMGVVLGAVGVIGVDPLGLLGVTGVVLVATIGANEIAARLARVVPHRESSIITALIIACLVPPQATTMSLVGAAAAGVLAALSKYLLVWRGRHVLNPAATGVLIAGFFGLTVGIWWIGTAAMLPVVAIGALLLLDRTRRLEIGVVFVAVAVVVYVGRGIAVGLPALDVLQNAVLLTPVVFLAGYMLTEPLTLPPRRWQQVLVAAVAGLLIFLPFAQPVGPFLLANSPELALVVGNLVGFAVSRRRGFALRLVDSRPLSDSAVELRFTPTRPVPFEAGQWLELHLPHRADVRGTRRIFSIASAPSAEHVAIGTRMLAEGSSFKRELAALEPGSLVRATQVSGDFVLPKDAAAPLLLLAGGIGVTPFASQLAELAHRGEQRDVVAVLVPSSPDEHLYRATLEQAGARIVVLDRDALTVDALREHVPDIGQRRGYVSGSPAVVAAGASALRAAGAKRVRTDYFAGY